jgi:glycosyltransferase involved in cell wall biosynthesis
MCVVGSGSRFFSGISCYTVRLANALAQPHDVSVILMRRLLPARFYPGRERVGKDLTQLRFGPSVRVFEGVDWYWLPSIFRALAFLLRQPPDVIVLQWWSGTVLHSYLVLALVARLTGARVVIEFHEVLDTGELRLTLARAYVKVVAPLLVRLANAFVVHSNFDRDAVQQRFPFRNRPVAVIPHGPYDHYRKATIGASTHADGSICNFLFFGVIRPFKGVEDLITAFDTIPEDEIEHYRLTVVGETWEGWNLPGELIARSHYREWITFINRYVRDDEVASFFAGADAVVLPYHRSSASGPLHVAMSYGLPVVVTCVGGLIEAVAAYEGAVLVPPRDPVALQAGMREAATLRARRYSDPHSWEYTIGQYAVLCGALAQGKARVREAVV